MKWTSHIVGLILGGRLPGPSYGTWLQIQHWKAPIDTCISAAIEYGLQPSHTRSMQAWLTNAAHGYWQSDWIHLLSLSDYSPSARVHQVFYSVFLGSSVVLRLLRLGLWRWNQEYSVLAQRAHTPCSQLLNAAVRSHLSHRASCYNFFEWISKGGFMVAWWLPNDKPSARFRVQPKTTGMRT